MSGFIVTFVHSAIAPAAAALAGGRDARRLLGRPSASVTLAAAVHVAALGVILVLQARVPIEPPGIEIRVWPSPPPAVLIQEPPSEHRSPHGPDGPGTPVPKPDEPPPTIPNALPGDVGPVRPVAPNRQEGPPSGRGDLDATPAAVALDGEPSVYEEPPTVTHAPDPEYPSAARGAGIEGKVILEALVGTDGRVRQVRVREGNPMLADAAREAVLRWRFRPARWNQKPVAAWVAIPVVFRLR
jgi:protein TonB